MEYLAIVKALVSVSDLSQYADNDVLLNYAIGFAIGKINRRRGYKPTPSVPIEPKYADLVPDVALWYLGKIGAEGYQSTSENGVSVVWQEVPDCLKDVTPRLGVL